MSDRLGDTLWLKIADDLRGVGLAWWRDNQDDLVELGQDEAAELFADLKAGRTVEAKMVLVARMSREEWRHYRDRTTDQLEGLAARRARLLDALGELGARAAQAIGKAALAAI
ncbi:MAG TPA: hypothetical protein VM285_00345 [Polyangia bacterium]|nr:hypothetical protein [Polyangia bacterium]